MKNYILLFFLLSSILSISQTTIVLDKESKTSIEDAVKKILKTENGYGTIFIEKNIEINKDLTIPQSIDLNFSNWNILSINNGAKVSIQGKIFSNDKTIFDVPVNHNLKIHNQEIYPEWFGLCSYLENKEKDDSELIQKGINACVEGSVLKLYGKNYNVASEIMINTKTLHIQGKNTLYFPAEGPSNNVTVINQNLDIIFDIKAPGVIFSNLNFTGFNGGKDYVNKGGNTKSTALNFVRNTPTNPKFPEPIKDVDAWVKNCTFLNFKNCIYGEGTNLKIIDNLFVASYIGVNLQEAKYIDSNGILQTNPHLRGHVIDRNRFHSMGGYFVNETLNDAACIKITAEKGYFFPDPYFDTPESFYVSGYYNQITNNYADDAKTFFEGSVDRTKIDNNVILNSTDTAIKAYGGEYGTISNNLIDGSFTWNPNKLYPYCEIGNPLNPSGCKETDGFPEGHGIRVRFADYVTITNNQIVNKRRHGIYLERTKNSSIQGNTIMNFNRHAYIRPNVNGINQTIKTGDIGKFDGIHIECTSTTIEQKYNVNNSVKNNVISMPFNPVGSNEPVGRYGIYVGDGDDLNFIASNSILPQRLLKTSKTRTATDVCESN
ncbi:MAG: right-handed parallel beta-helix repeat-containing protein [Patiriisocius sp.]|uniref:right-handed parallel beta-helix repeat-containing protein n=1 Tax=Patiriisocius sp. TaxID=2822396 RepID=UPI003EF46A8F